MYRGSLQYFYRNKGTHSSLDVVCPNFNVERIKIRQYLPNILKCDTSSDDMKEKIDHWLDSFENCHNGILLCRHNNTILHLFK